MTSPVAIPSVTLAHVTLHTFGESLRDSHRYGNMPEWILCYKQFFPGISERDIHSHQQDGWQQRAGIDKSIIRGDSFQILIDEKVRVNVPDGTNDILLEVWSDREKRVPGWVQTPLACHFIAYMILPRRKCHLLPVLQLQAAWKKHGEDWGRTFGVRKARNEWGGRSWTTESVPVPVNDLYAAIGATLHCSF
jgi:hypothetical protein